MIFSFPVKSPGPSALMFSRRFPLAGREGGNPWKGRRGWKEMEEWAPEKNLSVSMKT